MRNFVIKQTNIFIDDNSTPVKIVDVLGVEAILISSSIDFITKTLRYKNFILQKKTDKKMKTDSIEYSGRPNSILISENLKNNQENFR